MCIHWAALGQNDMKSPGRAGCCFFVGISLLSSAGRCRTGVLRPSTDVLWWSSVDSLAINTRFTSALCKPRRSRPARNIFYQAVLHQSSSPQSLSPSHSSPTSPCACLSPPEFSSGGKCREIVEKQNYK